MDIIKKLCKLIDVKSIVTLVLTAVFAYLSVVGVLSGAEFLSVFTVVIAFYFGTQYQKGVDDKETKSGGDINA